MFLENKFTQLFIRRVIFSILCVGVLIASGTESAHAAPSLTVTTPTANVTKANSQTINVATTTAAVNEVLASIIVSVLSMPADTTSVTIGTCVVNFSVTAGSTADETNCADDAATIDLDTGAGDAARNTADVSGVIATLTNVSDTDHGTLAVAATTATSTSFIGIASTTATSTIVFTDSTTGAVAATSTVNGVIGSIQVSTVTVGGTVEINDEFRVGLPTVGTLEVIASSTASTTTAVAEELYNAVITSAGYGAQAFTAATSSNTVVFTGKATGTVFVISASAVNASSTAQVSVITPGSVEDNYKYTVRINGTNYSYTSTNSTLKTIVEGIHTALSGASAVTCTENDSAVTCTAATPGTAFSISATVSEVSSGGGGGSSRSMSDNDDEDEEDESENEGESTSEETEGETESAYPSTITVASPITLARMQNLQNQIKDLIPLAGSLGVSLPKALLDFSNLTIITNNPSVALPQANLSVGVSGPEVTIIQNLLIGRATGPAAAYLQTVGATGYFGSITLAALAEYQEQSGIRPARGYYGPITRSQMQLAGLGN